MNYKLWNIKCTLLQILACERLKSTSFRYMLLLVYINWFDTLKAINSGTDVIFTVEIMLSKLTIVYCYHRSKKWRQKQQQNHRVLDSHKMKRIFTFILCFWKDMTAYSLILSTQSYNGYHPVNTKVFTDMIIKTETINFTDNSCTVQCFNPVTS